MAEKTVAAGQLPFAARKCNPIFHGRAFQKVKRAFVRATTLIPSAILVAGWNVRHFHLTTVRQARQYPRQRSAPSIVPCFLSALVYGGINEPKFCLRVFRLGGKVV